MKLQNVTTEMKEVTTIVEKPISVTVELTLEEIAYIQSRLDCSSFKTYAEFCPKRSIRRSVFAAAFRAATQIS